MDSEKLSNPTFELVKVDDGRPRAERREAIASRVVPPELRDLRASARTYRPDETLATAINTAIAVGAPLLVTGVPGTGKTQIAYWLAEHLNLELFTLNVKSTSSRSDLVYEFDDLAFFREAQSNRSAAPLDRQDPRFLRKGPLWRAYELDAPSVVLIDEIDKAPREFPNDLLHELAQHSFKVPWLDAEIVARHPPITIITSNSERRLPEAFLRRCIFHHIPLTSKLLQSAVDARFPEAPADLRAAVLACFTKLLEANLQKPPGTAELLVWMHLLLRAETMASDLQGKRLGELPFIHALVKTREDLDSIAGR